MKLFRKQAGLLMELFNAKEPVNGILLCRVSGIGLKTLKKEIDDINFQIKDEGFEILSKTGIGYEIKVKDKQAYKKFKELVSTKYHRYQFFRNFQSEMTHYILRRLLSADENYIEDIAEECYCSISTINRCMSVVRKHLNDYGLKLVNHTNCGMKVEGSEWNYRLALINEYQIYHDFKSQHNPDPEEKFERMFLSGGTYRKILAVSIRNVLFKENYIIPFDGVRKLVDLMILTMTRKKYGSRLKESHEIFRDNRFYLESKIIEEIYKKVPDSSSKELSEDELLSIAIFLKTKKIILYDEFVKNTNKGHIIKIIDDFIDCLDKKISIKQLDLVEYKQRLYCNLLMLEIRCKYNIHTAKSEVANFKTDGLLYLNICTLFYDFLINNSNIKCTEDDVLSFYPIFSRINAVSSKHYRKKVLIVSRFGYYYAQELAERFSRLDGNKRIEFIPCEYVMIDSFINENISCIATDIDEIRTNYSKWNTIMVHFYRKVYELNNLFNEIIFSKSTFKEEYFTIKDLYYINEIKSLEHLERYIVNNVLKDINNANNFFALFKKQSEIYSPVKLRQYILINTLGDVLNANIFKIIVLKKPSKLFDNPISMIIISNTADTSIENISKLNGWIAELIHSKNLVFSMNHNLDYEMLINIIESNTHL